MVTPNWRRSSARLATRGTERRVAASQHQGRAGARGDGAGVGPGAAAGVSIRITS